MGRIQSLPVPAFQSILGSVNKCERVSVWVLTERLLEDMDSSRLQGGFVSSGAPGKPQQLLFSRSQAGLGVLYSQPGLVSTGIDFPLAPMRRYS